MRLLDVGCGPGTITMDLAERVGPTGRVTALERTEDALSLAREEAARRGTTNVDFVVGDVQALNLRDDQFDVVHAHQVLQHLDDPVRGLREMRRVCRPGGLVADRESDYSAFAWYPQPPALDRWMAIYQRVARANNAEPDAGRRLLSWARAAGFTEVDAARAPGASPRPRTSPGGAGCGPSARSPPTWQDKRSTRASATRAELEEVAAGWRAWSQAEDGWFSVLHGEILARV